VQTSKPGVFEPDIEIDEEERVEVEIEDEQR
jgi:hypothetical protein